MRTPERTIRFFTCTSFCWVLVCVDGFTIANRALSSHARKTEKFIEATLPCLPLRATSTQDQQDAETAPSSGDADSGSGSLNEGSLRLLRNCGSSTQARNLLEEVLLSGRDSALYKSVTIPPGASEKGISDGDLAIQTRTVNKKYNIMDLIELSGDRDIDRASAALFGVLTGSILSAIAANQNLPGPEIIRFVVVWIFSFAPLFFVGYGIADVEKFQALLVTIQRDLFPLYRKRMIQHEAGRKSMLYCGDSQVSRLTTRNLQHVLTTPI